MGGDTAPNPGVGVKLPKIIMAWIVPLLGFLLVFALMVWLSSRLNTMRSPIPVGARAAISYADWLRRNWKAVTVAFIGLFILIGLLIALHITSSAARMRSSDAAKLAIATAEANPALTEKLGHPLKTGKLISGYVSESTGKALVIIPVSGPRGDGVLYADVWKQSGAWRLQSLVLRSKETAFNLDLVPVQNQKSRPGSSLP